MYLLVVIREHYFFRSGHGNKRFLRSLIIRYVLHAAGVSLRADAKSCGPLGLLQYKNVAFVLILSIP